MKTIFLCVAFLILFQIAQAQDFYIERVEVFDNFNSSYLLSNANVMLSPDRSVSMKQIECYIKEMKSSGLFEDIAWELEKTKDKDVYILKIKPKHKSNYSEITIDEIILQDFPQTNKEKFLENLSYENLTIKSKFISNSFSRIVDKIKTAIQKSSTSDPFNGTAEVPWVSIKESKDGGVKIIVSNDFIDLCKN